MNQLTIKRMRLLCWCLLYRVDAAEALGPEQMEAACRHCRLSLEELDELKRAFPREWQKLEEKRLRRRVFLEKFGYVPDGWTPPIKGENRTGNFPRAAIAARGDEEKASVQTLRAIFHRIWNERAHEGKPPQMI